MASSKLLGVRASLYAWAALKLASAVLLARTGSTLPPPQLYAEGLVILAPATRLFCSPLGHPLKSGRSAPNSPICFIRISA